MTENRHSRPFLFSLSSEGEYVFFSLSADQIAQATFLDLKNLNLENATPDRVPIGNYMPPGQTWPLRYLFHTAFCGSTLLSRALNETPRIMALKEPDVLMQISSRSLVVGNANVERLLSDCLAELSRPWAENGAVIIKPTNSVNRLLPEIMRCRPGKTILLHGGLEDFIVSCLKKMPAAETRVRWMAQHLLQESDLQKQLGVDPRHPFNILESCVITWYVQMEYFAKALAADSDDRIRTLDMKAMLADPVRTVVRVSEFLELDRPDAEVKAAVTREFSRNAKHVERQYSDADRAREAAALRKEFSSLIAVALNWAERNIAPFATIPKQFKPIC
jgi:hypothetical protein